jgi:hypothetical protein
MFDNVRIELVRNHMTMLDLSNETGIRYQTLSEKMRGNSPLLLKEAIAIKKALKTDMSLEELFAVQQVAS